MTNVNSVTCDQVRKFDSELTDLSTRTKNDVIKKITGVKSTSVLTRIRNAHYDIERFHANQRHTPVKVIQNGDHNGAIHLETTPERAVIEILDDAFGLDDLVQTTVKLDKKILHWLGRTSTRLNLSQSVLMNTVLRYFMARV